MALADFVAYRHAAWDTPWWVNPNRRAGRYNVRGADPPTQYACLHPLGPAAEFLRHSGPAIVDALDTVTIRLWAARIRADGLLRVTFDEAAGHGLTPEQLVGDDYGPTQAFAERLTEDGVPGIVVPSAALPGTEVAVLFGERVSAPYAAEVVDPEIEIATAHAAESRIPREVVPRVRWKGRPHAALESWRATGVPPVFDDPPGAR